MVGLGISSIKSFFGANSEAKIAFLQPSSAATSNGKAPSSRGSVESSHIQTEKNPNFVLTNDFLWVKKRVILKNTKT